MKLFTYLLAMLLIPLSVFSQWSNDPLQNNQLTEITGEQTLPKVASNPLFPGITYICWFSNENGNYNVRLQKMDLYGNEEFEHGGLLVSDNPSMSWITDYDMKMDDNGYAIITFQDIRHVNEQNDIFVYRISPTGEFVWGDDGIALSNNIDFEASPVCVVTDDNYSVFAWTKEETEGAEYIMLQKVSPEGEKMWGEEGIELRGDSGVFNTFPYLLRAGNGQVFIVYSKQYGSWMGEKYIFMQKLNSDGSFVWPEEKKIYFGAGIPFYPQDYSYDYDNNGGFFVSWHDDRNGDWNFSTFVQHVDADGNLLMPADGVEVNSNTANQHLDGTLAYCSALDDVYIFWSEQDANQEYQGLYGQMLSSSGEKLWGNNGKKFIDLDYKQISFVTTRNYESDAVVIYDDYDFGNVTESKIMAMRVNSDGGYVWTGEKIPVSLVQSDKAQRHVGTLDNGQWIMAWSDKRNDDGDLYAQNLQQNGSLGPVNVGISEMKTNSIFSVYPNPASQNATISFNLEKTTTITINVYAVDGKKVSAIFDGIKEKGEQSVFWNLTSDDGTSLPGGLYLIQLMDGSSVSTSKILIK